MESAEAILKRFVATSDSFNRFYREDVIGAMELYAAQFKNTIWQDIPKKQVYQYSTTQEPNVWHDATDSDYEAGKDLVRFNWRIIEK